MHMLYMLYCATKKVLSLPNVLKQGMPRLSPGNLTARAWTTLLARRDHQGGETAETTNIRQQVFINLIMSRSGMQLS